MPRPQYTEVTPPIRLIHNHHLPKSQHLNQTRCRQKTHQSLPMNSRQASCFTPTLPKKHTRMIFCGEQTARHWRKKSFMTRNREWFLFPLQRGVWKIKNYHHVCPFLLLLLLLFFFFFLFFGVSNILILVPCSCLLSFFSLMIPNFQQRLIVSCFSYRAVQDMSSKSKIHGGRGCCCACVPS